MSNIKVVETDIIQSEGTEYSDLTKAIAQAKDTMEDMLSGYFDHVIKMHIRDEQTNEAHNFNTSLLVAYMGSVAVTSASAIVTSFANFCHVTADNVTDEFHDEVYNMTRKHILKVIDQMHDGLSRAFTDFDTLEEFNNYFSSKHPKGDK